MPFKKHFLSDDSVSKPMLSSCGEGSDEPSCKASVNTNRQGVTSTLFIAAEDSFTSVVSADNHQVAMPDVYVVATIVKTPVDTARSTIADEDSLPELYNKLHKNPSDLICDPAPDENDITSTSLEVGSKAQKLQLYRKGEPLDIPSREPKCFRVPGSLTLPDHLRGLRERHKIEIVPESGLLQSFQVNLSIIRQLHHKRDNSVR